MLFRLTAKDYMEFFPDVPHSLPYNGSYRRKTALFLIEIWLTRPERPLLAKIVALWTSIFTIQCQNENKSIVCGKA